MKNAEQFTVLRLNSVTMPMGDEERKILATLNANIIEIEGESEEGISKAAENADAIKIGRAHV